MISEFSGNIRNSIYVMLDCVNISAKNSNERGCIQNSLLLTF
ncbi:hypothetical protein CNEO4_270006 [Clostridium neonatale]|uniref:Uncharacterized protein n=1 Tax=Clostridium neonatale TaxID=137838 RepID=A0AAD1YJI6_9CLOT|nr:hypothetical protein CNEO4_170048 [Clostridium neonatale]CAI3632551.1 hypothetical protein CNEO2_180042 [Clostridium neonatale]CAI3632906.1 hypothetical protein CNEO3_250030 [Clostridium neonatale]CAI3635480.1 hypothetical protein CNEO3_310032 [Clostridium neonatale]CAI3642621.1 hypothetical protein CNEO2_20031 [Clostridium neonatale]